MVKEKNFEITSIKNIKNRNHLKSHEIISGNETRIIDLFPHSKLTEVSHCFSFCSTTNTIVFVYERQRRFVVSRA